MKEGVDHIQSVVAAAAPAPLTPPDSAKEGVAL